MTRRTRTGNPCAWLATASLAIAPNAFALTGTDKDVVVTPLRTEVPREEVASAITVITGEELRQRQVRFLSDALRAVPGVAVSRSGGPGGLTSVRIRGGEADHTMVLIDGIQVNDPIAGGGYDFTNLLVDDIERIEILRGPQSVLYGGDAAAGVIHVITRRGEKGFSARGRFEHGSRNTNAGWLGVSGGSESTRFSLSGHTLATRGISQADRDLGHHDEDEFRDTAVSGTLDATLSDFLDAGGSLRLTRSRIDDDDFGPVDGDNRTRLDQFFGAGHLKFRFWDGHVLPEFRFAYADTERDRWDRDSAGHPKTSSLDGERIQLDFQTLIEIDETTQLLFGVDNEREKGESPVIEEHVWTHGYFAQARFAWNDQLFLTAGTRIDDHQEFGTHPTYRFTGLYHVPATGTRLKATWGSGFVAPDLSDLYFDSAFFVGNPNLDPERTRGWDIGFEQPLCDDQLEIGVSYFEQQTRDKITFVSNLFPLPGTLRNIDEATARGLEVSLLARPNDQVTIRGAYTWTRTRDGETHEDLPRRPYHTASLVADYRLLPALELDVAIYYNGRGEDTRSFVPDAGRKLGSFTLVNFAASYDLNEHVRIFGRVENLFDVDYQEISGYGSVGRSLFGGAELRF